MQTSERINYIKNWIVDYCKSMPKEPNTLVVGISGGIDSSLIVSLMQQNQKNTKTFTIGYENNDISGLFGINYFSLTENQHSDLYDVNHFSELINCCAIMDKPSYAIILCMGDYGEALLNVKNVFLQCSQILINKLNLILGDKTRVIDKGDLLLVICDNLIEDNALNLFIQLLNVLLFIIKKI